jgi:hypothetical protein
VARGSALSIEKAWNTVALEERIDLIAKSNAEGIVAAVMMLFFMGAVGYGFDNIWVLAAGVPGAMLIAPLFSGASWRKDKPELILKYLAARSVTRRYGYGAGIPDLEVVVIFRGMMRELFASAEEESLRRQHEDVDIDEPIADDREVWICLMVGGVIIISEKKGGAKLEFASPLAAEVHCKKVNRPDLPPEAVAINGAGMSKGRKIALWSSSRGAIYVFEKKVNQLVQEAIVAKNKILERIASE